MPLYKAVRILEGRKYSTFAWGSWRIEYKQGEFVTTTVGYLFIYEFESDEQAIEKAEEFTAGRELWEVTPGEIVKKASRFSLVSDWWGYFWSQGPEHEDCIRQAKNHNKYAMWTDKVRLDRLVADKPRK